MLGFTASRQLVPSSEKVEDSVFQQEAMHVPAILWEPLDCVVCHCSYLSPISMHSLMSRLDAVMTPQQHGTDNKKQQGSLEISALRSVSSR